MPTSRKMTSPPGTRTGPLTPSGGSVKIASLASATPPIPSIGSPRRSGPASRTVRPSLRASAAKSLATRSAFCASCALSRWAFICPSAASVARRVGAISFSSFRVAGTTSNTLRTW